MKVSSNITITLAFLVVFGSIYITAQSKTTGSKSTQKIKVNLDISSIEKLVLHPEDVLKKEDEFWANDMAHILLMQWANNNRITISKEDWRENVKKLTLVSNGERPRNKYLKAARQIISNKKKFETVAMPHLLSFLPESIPECATNIYFTLCIPASGFMTNGHIALNLSAKNLKDDVSYMQNLMLHEVFHIGYGYNRSNRMEYQLEKSYLYNLLDALQNEGMATYMAYKALSFYPTENEKDFNMLNKFDMVVSLKDKLNNFFKNAEKMSVDEIQKEGWTTGVQERAYYVTGAYMAKTIDEKLGRRALLYTVEQGPLSFVKLYNSIADMNMKIFEFKVPDAIPAWQELRHAYLNSENDKVDGLITKVLNEKTGDENGLNSIGYYLLGKKRYAEAIKVFKLIVALFPNSYNAYDSLAEGYLKAGDNKQSLENYEMALKLNPNAANAAKQVEMLKKMK